jgi:hypothetical protein
LIASRASPQAPRKRKEEQKRRKREEKREIRRRREEEMVDYFCIVVKANSLSY